MLRLVIALIFVLTARGTQAEERQSLAKPADKRPTKIWNRTGPLGETPKRLPDAYPLSDQENKGKWVKFEPMSDDYHVYGFEWGKDELRFYVDGVLVRSVENTHWHHPLHLIFDSETMPEWFGMPDDKDLPSTFSIEYVRAWKRSGSDRPGSAKLPPVPSASKTDERTQMARTLVAQMASGQFDKATQPFDETMKRVLPADKLKQAWDGVIRQYGPLQRTAEARTETIQKYKAVFVTCEFQRGPLDVKVVFTSEDKITGLFFTSSGKYKSPSYADLSKFDEEEVTVGKGIMRLPGTLAVPKGEGPFPAVVLVHGSGPNDRDETIGPNKPFRDLAHGLASREIAVLRYEKRTKEHQIMMALVSSSITVKEETIDDAVAAVETLVRHKKTDPKRIFVLGHSLGGMLVPRIGKAKDTIAGFIILAGSTRPLEDLVLEQTKYIVSLAGNLTEEEQKKVQDLERQVARVKSPDLSAATPKNELPFGAPATYWLDLRGYEPATEAKDLRKPMLILQGKRDYQTTMEDFANWKKALASRKDVSLVSYPKLNHLFMEGQGKSRPEEYAKPGNVAAVVVEDIVKWILDGL
jgi:dienelactone hydrolase